MKDAVDVIDKIKKLGGMPAVGIRQAQRKEAKDNLRKEWLEGWGRRKKCSCGGCFVELLHVSGAFIVYSSCLSSALFSDRFFDAQGLRPFQKW